MGPARPHTTTSDLYQRKRPHTTRRRTHVPEVTFVSVGVQTERENQNTCEQITSALLSMFAGPEEPIDQVILIDKSKEPLVYEFSNQRGKSLLSCE